MNTQQIFDKHKRRLITESLLKSVIAGIAIGFGINTVFAFLYWMFDFGGIWIGLATGSLLGAACGILLYLFKYKVSEKTVAQRIDSYGLEERMITMVELSEDDSCIADIQRGDAIKKLDCLPAKSIKFNISAIFTVLTSLIAVASITLTVLGALANAGKIPYGKDVLSGGADGKFEVLYTAGEGGTIRGEKSQDVSFGASTEKVFAEADDGWMFVRWDDGERSPERCEHNVSANMEMKAIFKKIDNTDSDDDDSDVADDLPYADVTEESGGGNSDQLGGENVKDDGEGGGGKWNDRNKFIDGATYYRDYLEFYYQYATGIFESDTEIPPEIIEFFETYFSGI